MASSAFARHYSRNHCCLLLLWVLRCFTSPRSLTPPYTFREQSPASRPVTFEVPPFGNPRIKARPPAPRGLSQVTTSFIGSWCLGIHRSHSVACRTHMSIETTKMLASTMKFSTHARNRTPHGTNPPDTRPPTKKPPHGRSLTTQQRAPSQPSTKNKPRPAPPARAGARAPHPPGNPSRHEKTGILRKEVIQPHLPVRLPCYDFVPIANPTFDHSPHQKMVVRPWASGVTNFHDVTGGVYKARERIHRSVADLRLLATPTSWGRVADPNPN